MFRRRDHLLPFLDRSDAGRQLSRALRDESREDAVVVGLARGGVVVAAEVARSLALPLDALAVRKVGHPLQPEYAIGGVTPGGGLYLSGADGLSEEEVAEAVVQAQAQADALDHRLHARRRNLDIAGKACLLVDDGLATGATMIAAVRWARVQGARRVVVAVPLGPPSTLARLEQEADQVVCLEAPQAFLAVGMGYVHFGQVGDEEVLALLEQSDGGSDPARQKAMIPAGTVELPGELVVPSEPAGTVVFAHGSGSSRFSPRNRLVASVLNAASLATLLLDLLTPEEELLRRNVFDVPLLAERLAAATRWLRAQPKGGTLPVGYFGASTGAAAALWAAADLPGEVRAVVSRGGRPDLAASRLVLVEAPTLLIVGGDDEVVLELNRVAFRELTCERELAVIPGATHLFEEPGALEAVAEQATRWFARHLVGSDPGV